MGVLDGVLVVALEQAVAAPYASFKLAAAGARVIKVERAGGDFARRYDRVVHGESAYFVWLNAGKESLVLDIKDPDDGAALHRILARADVFIQNLAPGAVERAGLDPEELRKWHPRLVTCSISGYGREGPYSTMKAYDNLLQGETGVLAVTGRPDAPAKVGISIGDIGAGLHAYAAILEALMARERTGEGRSIDLSLFDCLADWMSVPLLHHTYGGSAPPRSGMHHASIAPYGPYRTADGDTVMVAIQNEREWTRFCNDVLERPELAGDERFASNPSRVEHRKELNAAIDAVFGTRSTDELVDRLQRNAIAFGRVNTVADLAAHPQLRRRTVDSPSGPVVLPVSPVPLDGERGETPPRVPGVGEHTDAILREFGG